jgi:hypothetical protein
MNSLTTGRFLKSAVTLFALALVPIPFANQSLACRQAAVDHSASLITPQSPGDLDPSFGNNGVLLLQFQPANHQRDAWRRRAGDSEHFAHGRADR